jgi:hypothetical protein
MLVVTMFNSSSPICKRGMSLVMVWFPPQCGRGKQTQECSCHSSQCALILPGKPQIRSQTLPATVQPLPHGSCKAFPSNLQKCQTEECQLNWRARTALCTHVIKGMNRKQMAQKMKCWWETYHRTCLPNRFRLHIPYLKDMQNIIWEQAISAELTLLRELLVISDYWGIHSKVLAVQGHEEEGHGHNIQHLQVLVGIGTSQPGLQGPDIEIILSTV